MNRNSLKGVITQLMAWTGVAVLGAVVAFGQDPGAAGQAPAQPAAAQQGAPTDGQIEMDVVHALDASQALKNDLITAATIQSEVTLSGTVSSQASKQLAESIVSHVNGVTKVHNNLQIGDLGAAGQSPMPAPDAAEMPDADQSQAQQNMAGLPPPGPAPDQAAPRGQYPPQGQYPAQAPNAQQQPYPQQSPYPYPQQGAYPPPPPPWPQYQSPQYSQYPPQQYPQAPQAPAYVPARGPLTITPGTTCRCGPVSRSIARGPRMASRSSSPSFRTSPLAESWPFRAAPPCMAWFRM